MHGFSFPRTYLSIQAAFLPICHQELRFREWLQFKMAALTERKTHTVSYPSIWTFYVFFLSSESKVLRFQRMRLPFICEQRQSYERSVLQLHQKSFLAEGTTKRNPKICVTYRLNGPNILGILVSLLIFCKRKGESFYSFPSEVPVDKYRDICKTARLRLYFLRLL